MAIQFTGEYNLQTPSNNAAVMTPEGGSFSFWMQVPSTNVDDTATSLTANSYLLEFAYSFQAGVAASNEIFASFYGGADFSDAANYFAALSFNTPLLVVGTYSTTKLLLYINDNVPAFSTSTSGGPYFAASAPVRVGVGAVISTVPVALIVSQPAFYDYALTSTDVVNLLLGSANPLNTGTASLSGGAATWFATLDGTIGHAPQAGDAGLANSGTLGAGSGSINVLSSLNGSGSAEYVADLFYTPSVALTAYVESAGTLLVFFLTNLSDQLQNIQAVNGNPTIYVNGTEVTVSPHCGPVWTDGCLQCPFVAYQLPGTVGASDVVTYTLPGGAFACAAGFSGAVSSPATATNYVGQYEPGIGGKTSFQPNPSTMKMGVNHDYIDFLNYFNWTPAANALYRASGVWAWGYSRTATYNDSTGELLTFIPNDVYANSIFNTDVANGIDSTTGDPSPIGRYSIVFDDVNASTWTSNYAEGDNALHVWINANNNTSVGGDSSSGLENTGTALNWPVTVTNGQSGIEFEYDVPIATGQSIKFSTDSVNTYTIETGGFTRSFSLTSNFAGTSSSSATATVASTFTRTVSGTTVTVTYDITYPWVPNYEYGYNLNLTVCFKSATGNWGANDPVAGTPTITNFWIFTPGDSLTLADYPYFPNTNGNNRSNPLAASQNLINWLTAPNGAGPATLRCCQSIAGYGACPNMQNYSDCVSPSQWNWSPPSPPPIPISYSRFYNTNPSNETYAWSSTKVYHPLLGGLGSYGGSDSTGAYIDLSLAGGELDYGYYTGNQHTLSGSASVESGSATVMMTASQTYWGGQVLIFPTQPTIRYFVAETTTGTSFALTTNYTGENASGLTVSSWVGGIVEFVSTNPHGLRTGDSVSFGASSIGPSYIPITGGYGTTFSGASVTYGSEYVTFSEPVTIPTWPSGQYQTIVFSSDPTGQAYTIQVASSAKVAVTNGLDTITFASSVTLATGIQIWFAADDTGTAYTIQTGGTGTTFTLTSTYTGISSTSTTINFSRVLNATVAVSGNSEAITFSSSVTLSTGQQLSFSADSSNTVYTIASGGTGTTFALTSAYTGPNSAGTTANLVQTGTVFHFNPYYLGTNSTSATATLCAAIDTWLATSPVVVTGPTTFLVQIGPLCDAIAAGLAGATDV